LALLPQVVDAVRVPVICAGGIAVARGIVAALAPGAQAAQIGTAFLACAESAAPSAHRDKLFTEAARDTRLSPIYSGRLARSIPNRFMKEMAGELEMLPPYAVLNWLTGTIRKAAITQWRDDLIPLQAGQASPLVRYRSAAELMVTLVGETSQVIGRLAG
jgi:nitronate monooxygenase